MKYLIIVLIAIVTISCGNQQNDTVTKPVASTPISGFSDEKLPQISFEKNHHDFGEVTMGEVISYHFKFTNTGKSDLLIASAKASCGCTVPSYSTDPIAPGDNGTIEVSFDTDNRKGFQSKSVSIMANTVPNKTEISFQAMVNKSE